LSVKIPKKISLLRFPPQNKKKPITFLSGDWPIYFLSILNPSPLKTPFPCIAIIFMWVCCF
jgi:hypothetical protein